MQHTLVYWNKINIADVAQQPSILYAYSKTPLNAASLLRGIIGMLLYRTLY